MVSAARALCTRGGFKDEVLCLWELVFARSLCLWEALEDCRVADDDRRSPLLLCDTVGDVSDDVVRTELSVAGLKIQNGLN